MKKKINIPKSEEWKYKEVKYLIRTDILSSLKINWLYPQ